jgi:hypothetical protein
LDGLSDEFLRHDSVRDASNKDVRLAAPSPTSVDLTLQYANRALYRATAIHEARGGEKGTVRWIPPEEFSDLPLEDRPTFPDGSAPPSKKADLRR